MKSTKNATATMRQPKKAGSERLRRYVKIMEPNTAGRYSTRNNNRAEKFKGNARH